MKRLDFTDPKVFEKYQMELTAYFVERRDGYYSSECYKKLKNRVSQLDDAINLRATNRGRSSNRLTNDWLSKVIIPLEREQYISRRSVAKAAFSNDPLVTVEPSDGRDWDNARNMQDTLTSNWRKFKFREKAFNNCINYAAATGVAVVVSDFDSSMERYTDTVDSEFGTIRQTVDRPTYGVRNKVIHPFNYWQNPNVPDPCESDYRGWIERWTVAQLAKRVKSGGNYFKENIKKILEAAVKENKFDSKYFQKAYQTDLSRLGVDISFCYGTLNIKDNEEDDTVYYVEFVGDKIVRIEKDVWDRNLVPITMYSFEYPRFEYWWRNTDVENQIPYANIATVLFRTSIDAGLKALQRYILYDDRSGIDTAAINESHINGGFLKYSNKGDLDISKIFHEFAPSALNSGNTQYLMAENKEASNRLKPKPDYQRKELAGGVRNTTATAAMQMEAEGDIVENDYLGNFAEGLTDNAYTNCVILKQMLPEAFLVTPRANQNGRELMKRDILGEYQYKYVSSLAKSKMMQANNLMNAITFLQNLRNTGDPAWLNFNMPEIARKWTQMIDLPIDPDVVYPQQQAAPMAPMGPMMPRGQMDQMTQQVAPMEQNTPVPQQAEAMV